MDLVVVPDGEGLRSSEGQVSPGLSAGSPSTGDVRWVWPDTVRAYRPLVAGGCRLDRCHDLRLAAAILARSTSNAAPTPPWLDPAEAPAGALEGLAAPPPELAEVEREYARQQDLIAASSEPGRIRLLIAAESAGAMCAVEMRADGVPWSRERHHAILVELLGTRPAHGLRPRVLEDLAGSVRLALGAPWLNPDSPAELLRAMRSAGLDLRSTARWEVARHDHAVVAPLLRYKSLARLASANGWAWMDAWVDRSDEDGRADRFRPDYVPGGVVTGRWATTGGGALQIPKAIRSAVRADRGWSLVVADAAQIEPRVCAAMAHDTALAEAGRDRDLYQGLVEAGVVGSRRHAKIGMLGAMYGGTTGDSALVLPRLRRAFPRALTMLDQAARTGERGSVVRTWLGRTCPAPDEAWQAAQREAAMVDATAGSADRARAQARGWGRFTRNFVVQGTAAEWALCWMAEVRRRLRAMSPGPMTDPSGPGQGRPHLVYFLHDELVIHSPAADAQEVAVIVRESAAVAGRLLFGGFPITFPLDIAIVESYAEADP